MDLNQIPVLKILSIASNSPNKTALEFLNEEFSYQWLSENIEKLSDYIKALSNNHNNKLHVFVIGGSSVESVIASLSILASGNIYVPIDSNSPKARIQNILNSVSKGVVINTSKRTLEVNQDHLVINLVSKGKDLQVNDSFLKSINVDIQAEKVILNSTEESIVFFTSGSTGIPKGVILGQAGYYNWYSNVSKLIYLSDKDRVALTSSIGFDVSFGEILLPLMSGATLVIPGQEEILKDPITLMEWLSLNNITVFQCVPSLLKEMLNGTSNQFKSIRVLISTGEALPISLVKKFYNLNPSSIKVLNLYGPIEASIQVTYCWAHEYLESNYSTIPIGKPFDGVEILLKGTEGESEIIIKGIQLAIGYLSDQMTNKKFKRITSKSGVPDRGYLSGDVGYLNEKNDIVFKGRNDDLVKIRGNRVELGDIENTLLKHEIIIDACVVFFNKEIVVFASHIDQVSLLDIRRFLSNFLPSYMLPVKFYSIDEIPKMINGKKDKSSLIKSLENFQELK